jgi:hypothetical protein
VEQEPGDAQDQAGGQGVIPGLQPR